jgi:serine/threonine-protein kinase RsbW
MSEYPRGTRDPQSAENSEVSVEDRPTPAVTTAANGAAGAVGGNFVEVRIPAQSAYLSVLRTATAGLAARLDFTLDEIGDLRIAVDEACAILLQKAAPDVNLACRFDLSGDTLGITVSVPTVDGRPPTRDTFAWTVLTALAGEVDAGVGTGELGEQTVTISMLKRRGADTA